MRREWKFLNIYKMLSPLVGYSSTADTLHHTWGKKKWNDEFKGKLFFSDGQSNSCGVAIGFISNTSFQVSDRKQDESGRILILDVKISDSDDFFLINLYHANEESEQLNILLTLFNILDDITDLHRQNIILGGDFNIFFSQTYEAHGGNPKMKSESVAKFIHIKENLELSHIWWFTNPKKKRYTFRQWHVTGFIWRSLDYFLVSNALQESTSKADILTALSTDHSPMFFSLSKNVDISGLWKLNNSLCHKPNFPANTPRVFHVETTWERSFSRRFNVEYTWCVCKVRYWIEKSFKNCLQ